jgi:hypothetical protein
MLRSFILKGIGKTNTAMENYDQLTVQAGFELVLMELRAYFSRIGNLIEANVYIQTSPIVDLNSQVENVHKRPVPLDAVATASQLIYLKGKTDGTATDIIVELIADERPV